MTRNNWRACDGVEYVVLFCEGEGRDAATEEFLQNAAEEYLSRRGLAPRRVLRQGKKPVMEGGFPYLSVSHTEGLYLAAFAEEPVGVDAERAERLSLRVQNRYFSPEERKLPFAEVWTVREALSKLTGEGLSHALAAHVEGESVFLGERAYRRLTLWEDGYCLSFVRE